MDIFAGVRCGTPEMTMHNITKIKLFRILLRITYLPSLIILYPLAFLRKKSDNGLFFFFDRYSLGGAQRIHLDILKSIPETEKQVFFTRLSPNSLFRGEFYDIPNSANQDIHICCDWLIIRLFSVHYFSFYINRHGPAQVFGSNSTFFYDMLPFLSKQVIRTELLHNFTFGKKGMEFFGLESYRFLTHRIIYDYFTGENIKKQYEEYGIDHFWLRRILFIEPGVDIPPQKTKRFKHPLNIICAGRGGRQKRIWLINRIAEYFADQQESVRFHFAGTLLEDLSEKVKSNSVIHGEISDPERMTGLLSASDIALLTSLYEGFPMFIKEAMANACIPVVTGLPGNLMHLNDRSNSLLIHEIQDEAEIVRQGIRNIEELIRDRDLCIQLSDGAYDYAEKHFSRDQFNRSYRELLLAGRMTVDS
jgi:glycosyltransferase involved in cell wall biosynthesis